MPLTKVTAVMLATAMMVIDLMSVNVAVGKDLFLAADSLKTDLDEGQLVEIDNDTAFIYRKPGAFDFIKYFHQDLYQFGREAFKKDHLLMLGLITASTAALVALDQPILDEGQRFGNRLGLTGNNKMKRLFTVFGYPIEGPRDLDTGIYFIGDGITHITIAAGYLTFGLIKNDSRALQTASQLAEGMLTTGFSIQLLKHITGRESPFVATQEGGRWVPLPNQIEYHKHVPRYDAFPSGHLATAMMTVTVIGENYPEKRYIRPIGYTLMTILSFQMVNNGVHWVSDYPLALGMGYLFGKIAVNRGRKVKKKDFSSANSSKVSFRLAPTIGAGRVGIYVFF